MVIVPIRRPSRRPPAARRSSVCRIGSISPPPAPWSTRKAIREPVFHARPHSIDPARNTVSAIIHIRLAPKRPTSHPVAGIAIASASR
jgi:hypothetical protein